MKNVINKDFYLTFIIIILINSIINIINPKVFCEGMPWLTQGYHDIIQTIENNPKEFPILYETLYGEMINNTNEEVHITAESDVILQKFSNNSLELGKEFLKDQLNLMESSAYELEKYIKPYSDLIKINSDKSYQEIVISSINYLKEFYPNTIWSKTPEELSNSSSEINKLVKLIGSLNNTTAYIFAATISTYDEIQLKGLLEDQQTIMNVFYSKYNPVLTEATNL